MAEYVVLYDFASDVETDLVLTVGETIKLIQKDDSGWWLGENSEKEQGYFPSNLVELKKPPLPARPNHGRALPKPKAATISEDEELGKQAADGDDDEDDEGGGEWNIEEEDVPKQANRPMSMYGTPLENGHLDYETSRSEGAEFSITSLDAFDDLMNLGYCVEFKSTSGTGKGAIALGSRVELHCSASLWDGAATVIHQFSQGGLSVTVGSGHVTEGMDKALVRLADGDEAFIISSPDLAYGAAGHPPFVPPNSHIVFSVQISSVNSAPDDATASAPASGPKELVNIVSPGRRKAAEDDAKADDDENQRSLVFVEASDEGLTDDMLAQAAKSMDLGKSNN